MRFHFEGRCVLELARDEDTGKTTHAATSFNLDVSRNLARSAYLDREGLPTDIGAKALTNVFVQGLIANIHATHKKGWWNDAEHLRYIIDELQRGFVENTNITKSEFPG